MPLFSPANPLPDLALLASNPAITPELEDAARRGFWLLLLVSLIGLAAVVGLWLLVVIRRNREGQERFDQKRKRRSGRASAWHAAGARAEPLPPDPDLPRDDDLLPRNDDSDGETDPFHDDEPDEPDEPDDRPW